jgi:hypothetical protein
MAIVALPMQHAPIYLLSIPRGPRLFNKNGNKLFKFFYIYRRRCRGASVSTVGGGGAYILAN